nr:Rv3235 family protein [Mycobacterium riyadhense]
MSVPMRQAAMFADAALRRVLEVIDRRRPATQLRSLLAPSLVDSVLSVSRAVSPPQGVATLRRMRLQPVGRDAPDTAAEVFGTYSRGDRIHAIACRVERVPAGDRTRWLVVALHIG